MRSPAFIRLNADNPALIGITQFYQITPYHHQSHLCFDKKIEPLLQILEKITFTQCLIFSNYQARYVQIRIIFYFVRPFRSGGETVKSHFFFLELDCYVIN